MRTRFQGRRVGIPVALCAVILSFFPSASAAFKHISDGMVIPEVRGVSLQSGEKLSTKPSGIEGELTVVVFWASWSQRSLELLGDLEAMIQEFPDRPLRAIAINVEGELGDDSSRDRVRQMVDEAGYSFPVIVDEDLEIFREFGVIAVPSTAIADAEGVLLHGPAGYSVLVKDSIRDAVKRGLGLLSDEPEARPVAYRPNKDSSRRYGLALRLADQAQPERALKQVERAIEADPAFASPLALRGELLVELGRIDEALESFERAHELDDSSTVILAGWGSSLMARGDFDTATEKLEAALELEESYTPALLDLARCRIQATEFEDAIRILKQALELDPFDAQIHEALGHAYRATGDHAAAVRTYRQALEIRYPRP